ncbi:MAG: hypothetical protein H0V94_02400 [Actinobacteria bacterium]|nr:hypothetical protein [Actinomycetota bacterium]
MLRRLQRPFGQGLHGLRLRELLGGTGRSGQAGFGLLDWDGQSRLGGLRSRLRARGDRHERGRRVGRRRRLGRGRRLDNG